MSGRCSGSGCGGEVVARPPPRPTLPPPPPGSGAVSSATWRPHTTRISHPLRTCPDCTSGNSGKVMCVRGYNPGYNLITGSPLK